MARAQPLFDGAVRWAVRGAAALFERAVASLGAAGACSAGRLLDLHGRIFVWRDL